MLGRFGKFTLVERIAEGGMAEVFKATVRGPEGYERTVAIKRLHRAVCEDADLTQMLVDEARIAVQLNHPNIGNVFDLGCIENQYFIIMEYIDGTDVLHLLKEARLQRQLVPAEAAVFIVCELLSGLHHAHTKLGRNGHPLGIVHRDVSPQNIMVTWDGRVKLVDFGIAKARNRAQTTQHGIIKGKFYYMAPEQAQGHHVDPRTDVYAAGMVLYELLVGRSPYDDVPEVELLRAVRRADFPPAAAMRPEIDPALSALVEVATQRNPDRRFADALEFQRELHDLRQRLWGHFAEPQMARVVAQIANAEQSGHNFAPMDRVTYRPSEESLLFEQPDPAALEAAAGGSDIARERKNNPYGDNEVTQIYDANANKAPAFDDLPPRPPSGPSPWEESTRNDLPPRPPAGYVHHRYDDQRFEAGPPARYPDMPNPPPASGTDSLLQRASVKRFAFGVVTVLLLMIIGLLTYSLLNKKRTPDDLAVADAAIVTPNAGPTRVAVAFVSEPTNAQVFVNEVERGTTPLSLELEVGSSINVEFVKDGFEIARSEAVVQNPPQEVKVELAQARGIVKILSFPPDAVVTIDGDEQGTTPLTLTGLETDQTYEIVATLDTQSKTEKINWADNSDPIREVMFEFKDVDGGQMKLALGTLPDSIATKKKSSAPQRIRRTQPRKRAPAKAKTIEEKSVDVFAKQAPPEEEDFSVFGSTKSAPAAAASKSTGDDEDFSVFGSTKSAAKTPDKKPAEKPASSGSDEGFSAFGAAAKTAEKKAAPKPAPKPKVAENKAEEKKKEEKKSEGLGSIWGNGDTKTKKAAPKAKKAEPKEEEFSIW